MFPGHMPLEPRVEKFWVGDRSTRVGLGRAPHDCAVGLIIGILVLAYFCWSIARLSLQLGGEQQGLPPVADSAVMNVHRPERGTLTTPPNRRTWRMAFRVRCGVPRFRCRTKLGRARLQTGALGESKGSLHIGRRWMIKA